MMDKVIRAVGASILALSISVGAAACGSPEVPATESTSISPESGSDSTVPSSGSSVTVEASTPSEPGSVQESSSGEVTDESSVESSLAHPTDEFTPESSVPEVEVASTPASVEVASVMNNFFAEVAREAVAVSSKNSDSEGPSPVTDAEKEAVLKELFPRSVAFMDPAMKVEKKSGLIGVVVTTTMMSSTASVVTIADNGPVVTGETAHVPGSAMRIRGDAETEGNGDGGTFDLKFVNGAWVITDWAEGALTLDDAGAEEEEE